MHKLVAVFKHHFCHLTEIKPYQKWTECTAECSLYLHKIDNGEQFSVFVKLRERDRARGGTRKVTQRSFMDGGWWMVDILSLML